MTNNKEGRSPYRAWNKNKVGDWKVRWDKRHRDKPYCEHCLEITPSEKLFHLERYVFCSTCLPEAERELAAWQQMLSEINNGD